MRSFLRVVLVLIPVLASLLLPAVTSAANCHFVLGFKSLHDQIPSTVGDCLTDEYFNVQNGDALQQTTRGLLVWRKADNWTAYTDGNRTWINGPNGLQERLNTERFSWEAPLPSCSLPSTDIKFSQFQSGFDGAAYGQGVVTNPCDRPIDLMVDVSSEVSKDGTAVQDAPTVYVVNLGANQTRSFVARIPASAYVPWFRWQYSWFNDADKLTYCANVGATRCLKVDPWLLSTINTLSQFADGRSLLMVAADNGVQIVRGQTDIGVLGQYSHSTKTIIIDHRLDSYSADVRAAVLAHELQHAVDDAAGNYPTSSASCYLAEEAAFHREASIWAQLWPSTLPANVDSMHTELNDITLTVARDPIGFASSLIATYQSECGA